MLETYAIPVSLYCAKLRIVLRAKGLEWREIPPTGGYGSDEYKAIVPSGNLPALRDGGLLICDSEAIAEYLNDIRPEPPMLSHDPAARALERDRGRFHDTRLEPEVRRLFPYLPGRTEPEPGFLAAQARAIQARLDQLARFLALAPEAGDRLSLGDCGYPVTLAWLDELTPRMELGLSLPGPVARYRDRVAAQPAVAAELGDYGPKLAAFLDG
ncbi:MAG: glutathione S-transferase family protein [Paracoccaceae bacterium]|nr:glutathione S-transferase family protein [Paracoccaceae bacterium]